MRHRVFGKQLSRSTSHRKSLRRNMAASLIQHGAIRTTQAKAKELRPFVEKLITIARNGIASDRTLYARRRVITLLQDRDMVDDEGKLEDQTVVQKLFSEIAPRYADRPGGYTRIIRLSDRRIGDAGVQVLLQLVEESPAKTRETARTESRRRRRSAKRIDAARATQDAAAEAQSPAAAREGEEREAPAEQDRGHEAPQEGSGKEP